MDRCFRRGSGCRDGPDAFASSAAPRDVPLPEEGGRLEEYAKKRGGDVVVGVTLAAGGGAGATPIGRPAAAPDSLEGTLYGPCGIDCGADAGHHSALAGLSLRSRAATGQSPYSLVFPGADEANR
jgi:hypothetical protein